MRNSLGQFEKIEPDQIADHPTNPDLKFVHLTNQKGIAVIDAKYADAVGRYSWSILSRPTRHTAYAITNMKVNGKWRAVSLHRFIAGLAGLDLSRNIDHRNRNGLDCTEDNMRPATNNDNARNVGLRRDNKTGYKGVSWSRSHGRFGAQLAVNGHTTHLGYFDSKEDAARAYDLAALRHFGDFAVTNLPGGDAH